MVFFLSAWEKDIAGLSWAEEDAASVRTAARPAQRAERNHPLLSFFFFFFPKWMGFHSGVRQG